MRKTIFIWLFLLFSNIVLAQNITVKDRITHQPIEMVTVYSKNPEAGTFTDARGHADRTLFETADSICFKLTGYESFCLSKEELQRRKFVVYLDKQSISSFNGVIISATRWKQERSEIPTKITTITPDEIVLQNPQTTADMLANSGEVFIQKSQLGGGSPMIRGFATNRILITVDGVRMNTAIFRSGNLQNVISLDAFSTESAEVIFGPGSVIYGSDAIGGVMSFYTLTPHLSTDDRPLFKGSAALRTSTANVEKTGHIDLMLGLKKWAFVTSATFSDFDDQRMGSNGPDDYLRPEYATVINGIDSVIQNPDARKQVSTGYGQINLMQKVRFKPNESWDINYGFHYSATSDIPRYDRLIRYKNNQLRSAEWYYGPQSWMMNSVRVIHADSNFFYDKVSVTLSHQLFEESRHDRDFGSDIRSHRTEEVSVLSANLDFEQERGNRHDLFYGLEALFNTVSSSGTDKDRQTGISVPAPSRYPDGSTWNSFAGYFSYRYKANEKLAILSGVRYNQILVNATFDTTFYAFPSTEADINTGALTGSVGAAYRPLEDMQINLNLGTGFRAPNIDDIGKVFDSEPGAVVIPNPDLKPEYAYNIDLGIAKAFKEKIRVDLTGFYSLLRDALVRRNYTLNGQDSVLYEGELSQVQAIQNAASAYVYGIQTGVEVKLPMGFGALARFNYMVGKEELDDGSLAPLRHAPPWFASAHLTYTRDRFKADFFGNFNGEVSNANLAPSEQGKDYLYAADPNGDPYSPSWYTLNLKFMYQTLDFIALTAGVENILNTRYRPYSSGISAPGRNFIVAVRVNW